jgi:rhodanese-related sulfurtransferase
MAKATLNNPEKARQFFENKITFTLGPIELKSLIEEKEPIAVIDVRAAEDFAKGHVPGAINLPKSEWKSLKGLAKDRPNIVYCYTHVCHLAATACAEFAAAGFSVMEMEGGFKAWKEHDLKIETKEMSNRS